MPATGPSSPIVVTGLTNGLPYKFKVRARNSAGWGPYSSLSTTVTPVAGPPFADDFEDGVLASTWTKLTGDGSGVEAGGVYTITGGATTTTAYTYWNTSQNIANSRVYWKVPTLGTSSQWGFGAANWFSTHTNYFMFLYNGTNMVAGEVGPDALFVGGASSSFAVANGVWLQLRASGGQVFWESSTDGNTWTTRHTATTAPTFLTAGYFGLHSGASGQVATIDNLNTPPAITAASVLEQATIITSTATSVTQAGAFSGSNAWGPMKNRIVQTPIGEFATWISGSTQSQKSCNVSWRPPTGSGIPGAGAWNLVWTGFANTNESPSILWDGTRVLVAAWWSGASGQRAVVFYGTPNTTAGTLTMTQSNGPTATFAVIDAYMGAGLMNDASVVVTVPFGADGATQTIDCFRWTFNSGSPTWDARRNVATTNAALGTNNQGRYGYPHVLPARAGNAAWIVAERDSTWAEAGLTKPTAYTFPYVIDQVRAFRVADVTATTWSVSSVTVDQQAQTNSQNVPLCSSAYGGGHVDADERLHVLTQKSANYSDFEAVASPVTPTFNHTIVTPSPLAVSSQGQVPNISGSGLAAYLCLVENTSGTLFAVYTQDGGPNIRVTRYPDRASAAQTGVTTWSGLNVTTSVWGHLRPAGIRAGSARTNTPQFVFPPNGAASYDHFKLQLPTG